MTTGQNLIDQLTATGDYKVIRRPSPSTSTMTTQGLIMNIGLYLDTEITGLNPDTDKVIELAMPPFEYDAGGRIDRIHGFATDF